MEIIANAVQTVDVNQNILFTDTVVKGNRWISHRPGSGLITLKGVKGCDCQPNARYLVTFSGNIAGAAVTAVSEFSTIPEYGKFVESELSVAIAIDGEPIQATRMRVTVANTGNYYNVSGSTYIDVPNSCCVKISVRNTSTQAINVQNANLTAVRVA